MKRLAVLIPAALLVGLIIWRFSVNRHDKAAQVEAANARKRAPANVQVAPAVVRDIVHTFQGVGDVEAPSDVKIAPKVTGRLDYLEVREGTPVKRGQILVRIDPSQAQAAVNQQQAAVESARANLNNAEVRYKRNYSLYKQGFIAAQDIDDAKTQVSVQQGAYNAAMAQLRNVQSQLSDTILRSPTNGYVTARFYDPGSVVTAGQPIITVQAIRRVFVSTSVPEGTNQNIHVGMPATVEFDAIPGRKFTGAVRQVGTSADPVSRQFLVRAAFDNAQNIIRPGMYCRLTIVLQITHNAVVVPHEAIKPGKGGPSVVVVDDKLKAHQRPVQTGDQDGAGVAITQGIKPGEKVIILSAQPVKDGQTVKIDKGGPQSQLAGQPTIQGGGGGGRSAGPSAGGPNAPTYGGGAGSGATAFPSGSSGGGATGQTSGNGSSSTGTTGTSGGMSSGGSSAAGPTITPRSYSGATSPPSTGAPGTAGPGGASGGSGTGTGSPQGAPGGSGGQASPGTSGSPAAGAGAGGR
jgi:membrane fusion protein (multidrug efflux system)